MEYKRNHNNEKGNLDIPQFCDGCSDEHHQNTDNDTMLFEIITVTLSLVLFIAGFVPFLEGYAKFAFFLASAVLSGYELVPNALRELKCLKLDENLLVLIAVTVAFFIGEWVEAAAVSLLFKIGENVECYATEKSKKAIEKLYEITTDKATVLQPDGSSLEINTNNVRVGDVLIVPPYEKVPVDCISLSDSGNVDYSAITGEAVPVEISKGITVLSGSVNGSTVLKLRATAKFEDSAASKIIETVENTQSSKSSTEKFITKFASIYTPIVVLLAVLLAIIPSLVTGEWTSYIHRALVFLIVSCPCALVLSVPLGFFAAIGVQFKKGIIVKGGKFIEKLSKTNCILLDKSGTLNDTDFEIDKIYTSKGFSEKNILTVAAYGERYSTHPLAKAILNACSDIDEAQIKNFEEISGNGTKITLGGKSVLCGSRKFMYDNSVDTKGISDAQIYVAVNGNLIGAIVLSGKLRENTTSAVEALYKLGIKKIVMLTGDSENAAEITAEKCSIKEYYAGLLPSQKAEKLESYIAEGYSTAFVGDGINDALSLALADVGIAVGSGTAAAIDVGDVVLMNPNLENIANSVRMSRHSMNVIRFNIAFAIAVKIIVLILGAFGAAPMWAAVFADVGVCLISVLNSSRLLIDKN